MHDPNRERKGEIKYKIQLNEEQKLAKQIIRDNKIVLITGRAGCGKSLVSAQTSLDFLMKKETDRIFITRATVEVGESLGFLPGGLDEKFDPYIEAFKENLDKCYDIAKIEKLIKDKKILGCTVQFIRGKTMDDILVVEEAQNMTKGQMLAILTRLGKTGKIIVNGDLDQTDTKDKYTGLHYMIDLAKAIEGIKWVNLSTNHRADIVGEILNFEYNRKEEK